MKKPPAALAGGGLGATKLETPVGQAWLPARALGLVIRMAGMEATAGRAGKRIGLAPDRRMTLIRVEQRRGIRVKGAECGLGWRRAPQLAASCIGQCCRGDIGSRQRNRRMIVELSGGGRWVRGRYNASATRLGLSKS